MLWLAPKGNRLVKREPKMRICKSTTEKKEKESLRWDEIPPQVCTSQWRRDWAHVRQRNATTNTQTKKAQTTEAIGKNSRSILTASLFLFCIVLRYWEALWRTRKHRRCVQVATESTRREGWGRENTHKEEKKENFGAHGFTTPYSCEKVKRCRCSL